MEGDTGELYTVEAAAKILGRTPGRVRQLLRSGDLRGEHEGGDESKPWRVYAWSVHAHRDATRGGARERREGTARDATGAPASSPDMLRVVQDLQRELGRVEGRLELTARAESTAREDLERERANASRGFWRRLFGQRG